MSDQYPFSRGPYLAAALLCEKVLQESNGVKSIIRIVDRATRTPPVGSDSASEMSPFKCDLFLYLRFKSGSARGAMRLQIKLVKPSGESPSPLQQMINFEGEDDRGVDIVTEMKLELDQTGVFWFHIILNDFEITRLPFRVIYMPQIIQPSQTDNPRQD